MFQKGVNFRFFNKIYFCSSNYFNPLPLEFVNKSLGTPQDYGIDLGNHCYYGWLERRFFFFKEERSFGECSLRYLNANHVQLEWLPSRLGFSQAVMFLDFTMMLPEDFILQHTVWGVLGYSNFASLMYRPLGEVYFDRMYIKSESFTELSPTLIGLLRDVTSLRLKLGEHTSSRKLMCNQFFFSE